MRKSFYTVTYSDYRGKFPAHLPITWDTKFRSYKRAFELARGLHKQNRDVIVMESDKEGFIASWEFKAGYEKVWLTDFNEERKDLD